MRTISSFAGILLAFCFISEVSSQSSHSHQKSYSALSSITPTEEFFFFTLNDDEHGLELWRSDGTTPGTFLIKDIRRDQFSSSPSNFKLLNNKLYFTADDGIHGRELWCSDGTNEGTYLVADLSPGKSSSAIDMIEDNGDELLFLIDDETNGAVVWKSDGTFAGTVVVDDVENMHFDHDLQVSAMGRNIKKQLKNLRLEFLENSDDEENVVEGTTLFVATDARRGEELWSFNEHTVWLVKDIHRGTGDSFITGLTCLGSQVYFSAYDGLHGSELWKSDGTPDGTEMIIDIIPGTGSSLPRNFTGFDDRIYFSIVAENGIELWVTDGTREGTKEIFPAIPSQATPIAVEPAVPGDLSVTTTINEEGTISQVQVFPNPFTNIFHVRVESPWNENVAPTLMDMSSRTMYKAQEKTNANIQVETSLTKGPYVVRIRTRKNLETIRVTKAN